MTGVSPHALKNFTPISPVHGYDRVTCPRCTKTTRHAVGDDAVVGKVYQCDVCGLARAAGLARAQPGTAPEPSSGERAKPAPPVAAQPPERPRPELLDARQPPERLNRLTSDAGLVARIEMLNLGMSGATQLAAAMLQLGTDDGGRDSVASAVRELLAAAFDEAGRHGSDKPPAG